MITVSGTGTASASPDVMRVRLVSSVVRASVVEALAASEESAAAVRAVLHAAGVKPQDAATAGLSVNAEQAWSPDQQPRIVGYRSEHQMALTLRDISQAGRVLSDALAAGGDAIRLDGLSFDIEDPAPLRDEARAAAWADALRRAQQLAQLSGCTLGSVTMLSEQSGSMPPMPMMGMYAMASAKDGGAREIGLAPGSVSVEVTLSAQWSLISGAEEPVQRVG